MGNEAGGMRTAAEIRRIVVDRVFRLCSLARPMKRTYQPHNTRRARKYGFRARMASVGGRKIINNRRAKGRARLATKIYEK